MHEGVRCRGESARGRVEARHKRNLETANEFLQPMAALAPGGGPRTLILTILLDCTRKAVRVCG